MRFLESPWQRVWRTSLLQALLVLLFEIRHVQPRTCLSFAKCALLDCKIELRSRYPSFAPMLLLCKISFNQSKMKKKGNRSYAPGSATATEKKQLKKKKSPITAHTRSISNNLKIHPDVLPNTILDDLPYGVCGTLIVSYEQNWTYDSGKLFHG